MPEILLSITRFDRDVALRLAALTRELARIGSSRGSEQPCIAVHLCSPDPNHVTTETKQILRGFPTCMLVSGGWAGAPSALLTREELEWDTRWSGSNGEDSGLEQLFRRPVNAFFPAQATPAQVRFIAETANVPVFAGYSAPPVSSMLERFFLYVRGQWWIIPAWFLDTREAPFTPPAAPRAGFRPSGHAGNARGEPSGSGHTGNARGEPSSTGAPGAGTPPPHALDAPKLLHLVLHGMESSDLADPAALVERLLPFVPERPPDSPPLREHVCLEEPLPPLFAPVVPPDSPVALQFAPAEVAPLRREATLMRDRVSATLRTLSPHRSSPGRYASPPSRTTNDRGHGEFQGSTQGHLVMTEGSLTARFAGGRLAGITDEEGLATTPRRALGYIRDYARALPRTVYLHTEYAAWFSGRDFRSVEEKASLKPPQGMEAFSLTTRATLVERVPGLLLGYRLRFPRPVPEQPQAITIYRIPIARCREEEETVLTIVDSDYEKTDTVLPPGPGRWTVVARLLRIPTAVDQSVWIGSAEPGGRPAIAMEISRIPTDGGLMLSVEPVFAFTGVLPGEIAGTEITGTLILSNGRRTPEELEVGRDLPGHLPRFSRTVPE